jgi:DNA-3-methyladenine glycosylase II
LDGSLHGDVAVRRNLQLLLNTAEKPDEKTTQSWLATFSPWRALIAAHLWKMQKVEGF